MKHFSFSLPALFAAALIFSGCNVFEGLYESGLSSNPVVLMADAEQAMQQGKPEKAVQILEKAVEKTQPKTVERSKAQINLSTAKMAAASVSVMQIQRVIEGFNDRIEKGSGKSSGKMLGFAGAVCSFSAPDVQLEEITLSEIDGYTHISGKHEVLAEVQRLVNEALHITSKPGPQFDVQARIDSLRNAGLAQADIATALLNSALAYASSSYTHIVESGGDRIHWYRVRSAGSGDYYLGYCAPTQQVIEDVKDETACSMSDIAFSVRLLRARARFYDAGSLAHEIADKAQEGYDKLQEELDGTCAP